MKTLFPATAKDFEHWLFRRRPGQTITYHTGFLMRDKAHNAALTELARTVWKAHKQGRVELKQRKLREGRYAYMATTIGLAGMAPRDKLLEKLEAA